MCQLSTLDYKFCLQMKIIINFYNILETFLKQVTNPMCQ